jgi:hypothetical protein
MKNRGMVLFSILGTASLLASPCLLVSCEEAGPAATPAGPGADLVITNGKVITVDKDFSIAEAVAVKDGKIVAVGTSSEVSKFIGKNTRTLDLKGKTMLPGISDSHLHFQEFATKKSSPVLDMQLMFGSPPKTTRKQDKQSMLAAMQELNKLGITSITDPGLGEDYISIYNELYNEGKLTMRVSILWCFSARNVNDLQKIRDGLDLAGGPTGFGNEWLRIAGLKIGADNIPNDKSAWMREDYVTGGNGNIYFPGETDEERCQAMSDIISYAHKLGFQVGIHATGDRAIKACIDGFVKAESEDPKGLHHYIIHGDFTPVEKEITELIAKYGIGVSVQPDLAMKVGASMRQNISPEIMARFAPLRTLIDAGVHVSGGSDGPIFYPDWKQGIQAAILREMATGVVLGPAQCITLNEAIRMYTIEGAWQDHMEDIKGSIEVGKLADFCVLDEDILSVEPHRIKDIQTLMTIVDGKIVYNANPDVLRLK